MIHISNTETLPNKSIYKQDLLDNAKYKEWTIDKMEKYGSVDNFHKQRESGEDYFKRIWSTK